MAGAQDGWALKFAHASLKADKEIVLVAVRQNGWALLHAAEFFQEDKDVVMAAVSQAGMVLSTLLNHLKRRKRRWSLWRCAERSGTQRSRYPRGGRPKGGSPGRAF